MKKSDSSFENMLRDLLPPEQYSSIMQEQSDLKGWKPITLRELQAMSEEDRKKLLSYCWHDGRVRCSCIGITDLKVSPFKHSDRVQWSDTSGDPDFEVFDMDAPIHNIGDGEWNYGLYRK